MHVVSYLIVHSKMYELRQRKNKKISHRFLGAKELTFEGWVVSVEEALL